MSSSAQSLRVHFETSPRARASQHLGPALVEPAFAGFPDLRGRISPSFNDDPARTDEFLADAEVLMIAGPVPLDNLRERAPRLRWVQLCSAGAEHVLRHIPSEVALTNARGIHSDRTREIAMTALLMMNNHVPYFASNQRHGVWDQRPTTMIEGKTVVLVGLGGLGSACAEAARLLGLRVLGLSRTGAAQDNVDASHTMDGVGECFAQADFVIVTLPLTEATRGIVGADELDHLPPRAQIMNIGRSQVMDYDALRERLEDGRIAGAILDVFDKEPLVQDDPIWAVRNLFITPHAGLDNPDEYGRACMKIFIEDLGNFLSGHPLKRLVDPELGY